MSDPRGVPSEKLKAIIIEWKLQYGRTFPLYGNNTVRNDISGSVRPLLASTEIKHESLLAERSSVSKNTIKKIMEGKTKFVSIDTCDKLLVAMDRVDVWYNEFSDYYA